MKKVYFDMPHKDDDEDLPTPASICRSKISLTVHAELRMMNAQTKHIRSLREYSDGEIVGLEE